MNNIFLRVFFSVALFLSSTIFACLWDYDTLKMETQRFPEVLELITGKFLRHSKEFYEWRIEDRKKRLAENPNQLTLYDDLAVAYDKTGQHEKAIETILKKDKLSPNLYETYANLGTFYIHNKQLEKGLEFVQKAIEINPNAHFGREIYQVLVVQYLLSKQKDGKTPLPLSPEFLTTHSPAFWEFIKDKQKNSEQKDALKGVLGMMKFGNYESPILLEVLGNLLSNDENMFKDAKLLATRAYLKASYSVENEEAKKIYRDLANSALEMQTRSPTDSIQMTLGELERQLKLELEQSNKWYEQVRQDEIRWIREGKNPEEEFTKKYYQEPKVYETNDGADRNLEKKQQQALIVVALLSLALFVLLIKIRKTRVSR